MDLSRTSALKPYSLGIVVKDKDEDSDYIEVDPIEEFPLDNGPIASDSKKFETKLPDQHGVPKSSKLEGGSVIRAKWTPYGESNRDTAPNVRANETVLLFRFADTQEYYWTKILREPELRRLERVRYSFSNLPSGMEKYDSDTSYWIEFSTREKQVKIHTSDNDGEACTYDITVNTKEGSLTVEDGLGNSIILDSVSGILTANINQKIELNTTEVVINASSSFELNTSTSTINAASHTENAASSITGGLSVSGGSGVSVAGDIGVQGSIDATGSIIDGGGNTNNHSH